MQKKNESNPIPSTNEFISLVSSLESSLKEFSVDLKEPNRWNVKLFEETPVGRALNSKEDVLHIVKKVKSWSSSAFSPKVVSIHVNEYHQQLSTIKITQFLKTIQGKKTTFPELAVTLCYKNNERDYSFIQGEKTVGIYDKIIKMGTLLQIAEFSLSKSNREEQIETAPLNGWNGDWENPVTHGLYYDQINDPLIIEQYKIHLPLLAKTLTGDETLTILDLGAGKGRMAQKILKETLEKEIGLHYILVEPSASQLKIAKERLKEFSLTKGCKVTFIQSTLDALNLDIKAHCIISSGGPFNIDIVTPLDAIDNVKKMQNLLLPNGIFIGTGQTAFLVKAKHFKQAGLDVLSYAAPCSTPKEFENSEFLKKSTLVAGFFGHYQRYVCKKPAVAKENDTNEITQVLQTK